MTFKGTVKIEQEEDWIVATCFENNIASQGKTTDEANKEKLNASRNNFGGNLWV